MGKASGMLESSMKVINLMSTNVTTEADEVVESPKDSYFVKEEMEKLKAENQRLSQEL